MRIDSSGKVNIGRTTMSQLLNIQTASTSGLAQIEFRNTGGGSQIGMPANTNALSMFTGDAERMRIDSSGNVGIGTSSPEKALHIKSTSNQLRLQDSTNDKKYDLNVDGSNFSIDDMSAGSSRFTIKDGGNVGIGTSSPSQKFEVFPDDDHAAIIGRAKVGNLGYSDFAGFAHLDSGSQYAILQHNTGETYVNAASGYPINFRINNANIGRIDTDGLKFGTDTAAANALDDYEEGTWTPAYNNGGSISYATRYGSYVKIGRLVHLACNIDVNTVSGTNAGAMQITGAPFTNDGVDETGGSVGINLSGWLNGSGSDTIQINATDAVILPSKDTKNDIYRGTDIGTGFVRWSIVYMTDE